MATCQNQMDVVMYDLIYDNSTSMMFNYNQLTLLKFISKRDYLDCSIYTFYKQYFDNCMRDNLIYDIFEYLEISSNNHLENISIDYYQTRDTSFLMINIKQDSYDFIAYESYLKKLGYQIESTYESIDEFLDGQITDHLECELTEDDHIRLGINYGEIETYDFYLPYLELVDTIQELIKLDKLISERKFLFKLKGFNKLNKPISLTEVGLFFYVNIFLIFNYSLKIHLRNS